MYIIWTDLNELMKNCLLFVMQVRHCLFKPSVLPTTQEHEDTSGHIVLETIRAFKRPNPPCDIEYHKFKRQKSFSFHALRENIPTSTPPSLQRCFSETEATIKSALQRCEYLSLSQTQFLPSFNLQCRILHTKVCFSVLSLSVPHTVLAWANTHTA
jgi:hypothetical protein